MGGGKGGSADSSGMMEAMASAQAAQEAYNLGEQQLQWTQQVWAQEQPLMDASEKQQMALSAQEQSSMAQAQAEAQQQWQQYQQLYAPLEATYVGQAENWASPQNIALQRGQAMGAVGAAGQAQLNAAAEQLRAYGVNPSSPRYASLFTSAQPMLGAAQAAAGTTAEQNLKLQQMGLESGAINTGRGLVNAATGLTSAGTSAGQAATGAASGAASTAQQNLATGSQAMTAPSQWFNAGANNMNSYVNAVNGYNEAQAGFAQAGATEMSGLGSALGSLTGLGMMGWMRSDERDKTDIKREGISPDGIPLYSYRYKEDPKSYPKVVGPMAQDIAQIAPHKVRAIPGSAGTLMVEFADGGGVDVSSIADKYITRTGQPVAQRPAIPMGPSASVADRYISPTGGAPVAPVAPPMAPSQPPPAPAPSSGGLSPESQRFIFRQGGVQNAQDWLSRNYPNGVPEDAHPALQTIHAELGPRPMTPPQMTTRAPTQLQGIEARMMQQREAPSTAPTAVGEWRGGSIRRYQDGGELIPTDPQFTPSQGGGQTGIPSQPLPPAQAPAGLPSDATPGGGVPASASPSGGTQTDDVPAMLTANEFVIPKDVAMWKGHEYFAKQIDMARKGQQAFASRDDIGGEPTAAIPQRPNFVSRPQPGMTAGRPPAMPGGIPSSAFG